MVWSLDRFEALDSFLLPSPVAAVVAIGMVWGCVELARFVTRRFARECGPFELACAFIATVAGLSALVHALAWVGWIPLIPLRFAGWALAAFGWIGLTRTARRHRTALARVVTDWRALPWGDRALVALATTVLGLTYLAACAPAVDGDSLSYHLGVGLEWLRQGRAEPRPDWFSARHAALGEAMNLLGLAAGTDRVGALFQFSGLVLAVVVLRECAVDAAGRRLGLVLVGTVPLLVALTQAQKWQVLPAAALALAIVAALKAREAGRERLLVAAVVAIAFAVGCKLSFAVPGCVATLVVIASASQTRRLASTVVAGVAAGVVVLAPVWLRTCLFYGDPVSPMSEAFRALPDPVLLACRAYLQEAAYPRTLAGLAGFVSNAVLATSPSHATEGLGFGLFGMVLLLGLRGEARALAAAALASTTLSLVFTQLSVRFVVDGLLLASAALVAGGAGTWRARFVLALQGGLALATACFSVVSQSPGIFTEALRVRVMERSASEYADARWIDTVLPEGSRMVSFLRSHALLPRAFAAYRGCVELLPEDPPYARCQLMRSLANEPADYVVRRTPADPAFALADTFASPTGDRHTFHEATRNPWLSGAAYDLEVLNIDRERLEDALDAFAHAQPWCRIERPARSSAGPLVDRRRN